MGDHRQSLVNNHHASEAEGRSEGGQHDDVMGLQSTVYEGRAAKDLEDQDLNNGELGFEHQEEEIPPEELAEEEFLDVQDPGEAFSESEKVLKKDDEEEDVPEMSRLSINQRSPSTSVVRRRKKRRRLCDLAKPKTNWQVLKDRTTPILPIPRSALEYQASSRLRELATPRVRNNIWNINMSEVSQVSRAAQVATPSPRILQLAKPRVPATLLEEWDPVPKPKPHVSDYNRLLQLAMPKVQSEKCVPDRSPCWEVLDATKKVVASSRIISLAKPKVHKDLNEGYDPYYISPASLVARASPRLYELATPKSITKKV